MQLWLTENLKLERVIVIGHSFALTILAVPSIKIVTCSGRCI